MRLMAERYASDGMVPEAGDVEPQTKLLGQPLHTNREFAVEMMRAGLRWTG